MYYFRRRRIILCPCSLPDFRVLHELPQMGILCKCRCMGRRGSIERAAVLTTYAELEKNIIVASGRNCRA